MSGTGRRVLLVGGTSAIGRALVEALAARETSDAPELSVTVREESAFTFPDGVRPGLVTTLELTDTASIQRGLQRVFDNAHFDLVIVAAGTLGPPQRTLDAHPEQGRDLVQTNLTGTIGLVDALIEHLGRRGGGQILFLSSIAAVRRRPANALYGDTKRGVERHLAHRRRAAARSGVRLRVLRLGFVHSPMTAGLRPAVLARTPEEVATEVIGRINSRRDLLWAPGALRWVAYALRVMPSWVLRRIER